MTDGQSKVLKQALKYLARREYYQTELKLKLLSKGYAECDIEDVLNRLIGDGILSDYRFIESFIDARQSKFYGPLRIVSELEHKNFSPSIIKEVMLAQPVDWTKNARTCIHKKFRKIPANKEEYQKQWGFLHRRGYPAEIIRVVLGTV